MADGAYRVSDDYDQGPRPPSGPPRPQVRYIAAKTHEFVHEDVTWIVYSHKSIINPEVEIVRLIGPNVEIAVEALTRGEGMVMLADMMKSLGYRLSKEAFEQEGAVRVK